MCIFPTRGSANCTNWGASGAWTRPLLSSFVLILWLSHPLRPQKSVCHSSHYCHRELKPHSATTGLSKLHKKQQREWRTHGLSQDGNRDLEKWRSEFVQWKEWWNLLWVSLASLYALVPTSGWCWKADISISKRRKQTQKSAVTCPRSHSSVAEAGSQSGFL